jgi:hypothetical protein
LAKTVGKGVAKVYAVTTVITEEIELVVLDEDVVVEDEVVTFDEDDEVDELVDVVVDCIDDVEMLDVDVVEAPKGPLLHMVCIG